MATAYPTILANIAAMPESARLQLLADLIQPSVSTPIPAWSDFAGDALLPLSNTLDKHWLLFNAAMTAANEDTFCASGRDGSSDPYFAGGRA